MEERKIHSVLLIDDDSDDRLLFAEALKKVDKSITCILYEDSEKALKDLSSFTINPDYIFLDLNMPKLDGFQVLEKLRLVKRFWHIPIIIYSTTHAATEIAKAKAKGASHFISKPSSMDGIVKEVSSALEKCSVT